MIKRGLFFLFSIATFIAKAQGESNAAQQSFFYADLKIYVVVAVLTIILVGIFIYLFRLEKRLKKLEE